MSKLNVMPWNSINLLKINIHINDTIHVGYIKVIKARKKVHC